MPKIGLAPVADVKEVLAPRQTGVPSAPAPSAPAQSPAKRQPVPEVKPSIVRTTPVQTPLNKPKAKANVEFKIGLELFSDGRIVLSLTPEPTGVDVEELRQVILAWLKP
jgi:hypothetical protein